MYSGLIRGQLGALRRVLDPVCFLNAFIQICSHTFRLLHDASQRGQIYVTVTVAVDCKILYVADRSSYAIDKFVLGDPNSRYNVSQSCLSLVLRRSAGALPPCRRLIAMPPWSRGSYGLARTATNWRFNNLYSKTKILKTVGGEGGWQPGFA